MQQEFSLSSEMHNFSRNIQNGISLLKNFYRTFIVKKLKRRRNIKKKRKGLVGSIIYARLYFINIYYLHIITSHFYLLLKIVHKFYFLTLQLQFSMTIIFKTLFMLLSVFKPLIRMRMCI